MNLKPKDEPTKPKELNFEQWALAKYREIKKSIDPCDENGRLHPQRLNEVLTQFAQHFAWSITVQEVETNKLNKMNHAYDQWYKSCYNQTLRVIREESGGAGRAPGQVTIEARLVETFGQDQATRQEALSNQKSRVDLLKGFVKVLERQASTLQTLSSNMRSELFFASGVTVGGNVSEADKTNVAKSSLRNALRAQG